VFLLRLDTTDDTYMVTSKSNDELAPLLHINQSSIDYCTEVDLTDEQERPCMLAKTLPLLRERINAEVFSRESFFDNIEDPTVEHDDKLSRTIGAELDLLIKASNEI